MFILCPFNYANIVMKVPPKSLLFKSEIRKNNQLTIHSRAYFNSLVIQMELHKKLSSI